MSRARWLLQAKPADRMLALDRGLGVAAGDR